MSFNQTRDILDHARDFHCRLIRFYKGLKNMADNEVTQLLINDLVEHEKQLESNLADYEQSVSDNTLDTFFKYMVSATDHTFSNYPVPEEINTDYIIHATRYFDEKLARFYENMAEKAVSISVREMLKNLQRLEKQEQLELSKLILSLQETT